ncbi:MAG: helix-turn-helix transcriptional regulator [Bacillota bacterium]|nr:helix-turn-helix transcriptional regulator [Bacillota bacterium]
MSFEDLIGNNIREVRLERGLSQEALANACDFSNTTLSAYENGRKIPSLVTIAKIAKQLNVSIERLYYGDENNAFIISAPDEGRKIVNSIFLLWEQGVISYYRNYNSDMDVQTYHKLEEPKGVFLHLDDYSDQI